METTEFSSILMVLYCNDYIKSLTALFPTAVIFCTVSRQYDSKVSSKKVWIKKKQQKKELNNSSLEGEAARSVCCYLQVVGKIAEAVGCS